MESANAAIGLVAVGLAAAAVDYLSASLPQQCIDQPPQLHINAVAGRLWSSIKSDNMQLLANAAALVICCEIVWTALILLRVALRAAGFIALLFF